MPLQNRVTPMGELIADPARGLLFGNRGCLHDDAGTIVRRQATRRWISCRLSFKGRHREVMPPGRYTGLFFLDEATAFAAGHRPCAECRRVDFDAVKARYGPADAIDARLATERGRTHRHENPPTGTMVLHDGTPHLVHERRLRAWTPAGYGEPVKRPGGALEVITPPSLVALLDDGWHADLPLLHPSVR